MKRTFLSFAVLAIGASLTLAAAAAPKLDNLFRMDELIKEGADPNEPLYYDKMSPKTRRGNYYPLDAAVDSMQAFFITKLLDHGAKPRGNELADAAYCFSHPQELEMCKVLLKAGLDPNASGGANPHGYYGPPIAAAALRGNRQLVELLLAQPGIKPDNAAGDGYTALLHAAEKNSVEIAGLLLKAGADPNVINKRSGAPGHVGPAIAEAAARGNEEMVVLLAGQPGIKIDLASEGGDTALMHAVRKGSPTMVASLLKAGADPNLKSGTGETPLVRMQKEIESRQAILETLQSAGK